MNAIQIQDPERALGRSATAGITCAGFVEKANSRRPQFAKWMFAFLFAMFPIGCNRSQPPSSSNETQSESQPQLFKGVTKTLGIDFIHKLADHEQTYFTPLCLGSGAALFDYDNDGLLDLYFVQNGGPGSNVKNQLYRQTTSGFKNVSSGSGLDLDGYGMGVACGDVNNDGRPDVLLNEYGRARLLLNGTTNDTPKFTDITKSSGLNNDMWGTSTCFFDYDRDGWLDMVLVNYVNYDPSRWCAAGGGRQDYCGPDAFPGRVTKLFRNLGSEKGDSQKSDTTPSPVRFEDVTISSGFGEHPGPGLGVFCADFDGDRWPDVFIANDGRPNHLWINQRDGTFREEAITRGLGYNSMGKSEADMGIAIGDVDSDGMFDIFITHLTSETHTLWTQGPRGIFVDRTATSGVTAAAWRGTGFGTALVDLDNDGDLDLVIANGRVSRSTAEKQAYPEGLPPFWQPYGERDQIILNDGKGKFSDASLVNDDACKAAGVSRGLVCGDFNNDGAIDLVVTRIAGPPVFLENVAQNSNHWLTVRAIDPALKRDAYGSEVYVKSGERTFMRWINPGYSYLCSNDPRAHFGLGEMTSFDAIEVLWPDGSRERFPGGAADQFLTLKRGEGRGSAD